MTEISVDPRKPCDVVAAGAWTNFDHLSRLEQLPRPGDTVTLASPIEKVEAVYFGGCAPNTVAAAARLGARTGLVSVVGEDFVERGQSAYYTAMGVDLVGLKIVAGMRCGHSYIFTDSRGDSMTFSHLGVAERLDDYHPEEQQLSNTRVLVLNYRFGRFSLECARIGLEAGAVVIVSGSLATAPEHAAAILGSAHIVVCNQHEVDLLMDVNM